MIDERAYELLCCQLGLANEEKAGLRKQNKELIARLESIEKSNRENSKGLSLKPWGIALKFLFLHHENILFPND